MNPDYAMDEIRRLRPYSIETLEQEDSIRRYAAHCRQASFGESKDEDKKSEQTV